MRLRQIPAVELHRRAAVSPVIRAHGLGEQQSILSALPVRLREKAFVVQVSQHVAGIVPEFLAAAETQPLRDLPIVLFEVVCIARDGVGEGHYELRSVRGERPEEGPRCHTRQRIEDA